MATSRRDDLSALVRSIPRRTVAEAVDAAVAGETGGWDDLVEHLYEVVHRYALARLGDVSAAEEVTQEVFVAATRSLSGLRTRNEIATRAWFLRIAHFRVTDHIRQTMSRNAARVEAVAAPADPEQMVVQRQDAAEVRAAMEQLTDVQREVLLRRFVLDQSLEEVAKATARPVGAVKSLQHRALQSLSRLLEPRDRRDRHE